MRIGSLWTTHSADLNPVALSILRVITYFLYLQHRFIGLAVRLANSYNHRSQVQQWPA